jgi:hypothetical protein
MHKKTVQDVNYDSVFTPAQSGKAASLEILLKLALLPHDPKAGQSSLTFAGESRSASKGHKTVSDRTQVEYGRVKDAKDFRFNCKTWLKADFNAFRDKFVSVVQGVWNNQIVLIPPEEGLGPLILQELTLSGNKFPYLDAKLRITFRDLADTSNQRSHGSMAVALLDRQNAGKQEDNVVTQSFRFGANMLMICNEDIEPRTAEIERDTGKFNRTSIAAAHEVGHWLGSPVPDEQVDRPFYHIDQGKCAQSIYEDCTYGSTKERTNSIMGAGMKALEYDAEPWLRRIRQHSNVKNDWMFIHKDDLKLYLEHGRDYKTAISKQRK